MSEARRRPLPPPAHSGPTRRRPLPPPTTPGRPANDRCQRRRHPARPAWTKAADQATPRIEHQRAPGPSPTWLANDEDGPDAELLAQKRRRGPRWPRRRRRRDHAANWLDDQEPHPSGCPRTWPTPADERRSPATLEEESCGDPLGQAAARRRGAHAVSRPSRPASNRRGNEANVLRFCCPTRSGGSAGSAG